MMQSSHKIAELQCKGVFLLIYPLSSRKVTTK